MYVMPIIDMLVDFTANNELLSFMDGFTRYNQILLVIDDISKTTFRCPGSLGLFEWMVMLFCLKNADATYQRAMNAIFNDMLGHHMEIYIDDILVKSKKVAEDVNHLRKSFEMMRLHQLKLNPLQCAFRVQAGNFVGFLVHQTGVEVDQNKARAIISAKAPQNKKELHKLLGQVNYLRNFISNMVGKTKVFSDLIKPKEVEEFKWEKQHQIAFDGIKGYLCKPTVLMPPLKGRPLKLYLSTAKESIGFLLTQNNAEGHEQVVYYLSRILNSTKTRYTPIEKLCLALYFAYMKLRHYMIKFQVYVVSQTNLMKYILSRPLITR